MKHSDSDSNNPIPYKYIDADNRVYKDPYLNNKNEESSEDLISKKSQKSKSKKRRKSKKINKDKLSEDEIYELIEEKNADIIELNKKTETLKLKLTSFVKKLNEKITQNAEILYRKDPSPTEIQWLKEEYDSKKRALQIEQKINHSYKVQYNILENKLKNRKNLKDSKNDSGSLENETNVNKTQSIKSLKITNKSANISSNLYMSLEDQINKVRNENKDLLIKIGNIKNKKVSQKKEVDNIINGEYENEFRIKNDELHKLQSLRADAIEKYKTTFKSLDMVKKKIEYFEEKIKRNQNKGENEKENNHEYNNEIDDTQLKEYNFWLTLIKEEINNKNQEEILDILKNGQSNFINELKKNKKKIIKKKKQLQDMSTDMNIINDNNKDNNNQNNIIKKESIKKENKNIYKLFSILNNTNSNSNKNIKINKNENIKNDNEKLSKLSNDQNFINEITDIEYRELINKKDEYLETNTRLEKNIKDFLRTENSKISKISKSIKEKGTQLKIIKEKNELIQSEVNNLENIYQLSLEKEKIREEIEQKMTIKNNQKSNDKNEDNKEKLNNIKINKNLDEINKSSISNTREEQLRLIKKKYMEEDNKGNNNEESNNQFLENEDIQYNDEIENLVENKKDNNENINNEEIVEIDYNALKLEQVPFKV